VPVRVTWPWTRAALGARRITCARAVQGLAHFHARAMIHGDVKPENILVDGGGRAMLGDLGLARRVVSDRDSDDGDGRFVAPELLDGAPPTPAVDAFSLGASARGGGGGGVRCCAPFEACSACELCACVSHSRERARPARARASGCVMFGMVWDIPPGDAERAWSDARGGAFPPRPPNRHKALARMVKRLMRRAPGERDTAATVVARLDALLPSLAHPGARAALVQPAAARALASADARRSAHVTRPPPVALRGGGAGAGAAAAAAAVTSPPLTVAQARPASRARRAMLT
jgi:serine/threonine protein kinase